MIMSSQQADTYHIVDKINESAKMPYLEVAYFKFTLETYIFLLEKQIFREEKERDRSSIYWSTPQKVTTARDKSI